MPKYKIWKLQKFDKEKAKTLAETLQISPIITGILLNRGIETEEEMRDFLYGNPKVYYEPLLMKNMDKASERILKAIKDQEQITVYGDYDVDGITASSLLMLFLRDQGAKVNTYIPKRKGEGYGLNSEALKTISEGKTTLLITVDCGISGFNEVATAPQGMDIIITDHHMPPAKMPPAFAIINPKQEGCQYPFKELSGVGVAFKLCQAIYQMEHLTEPLWEKYTELAALGTVADIVSLRGENRELVKRGLKALETTKLIGLRKLMELSMCPTKDITSDNIGFIIAPRLNAVGRLEHAQLAVELLTTDDSAKAQSIAENLNKENALRQDISRKIFEEACAMLAEQKQIKTAIVLAKEGWHAGVIGIVASRLVDKYNLPTILISIDGKNAKGSCRSIPALDLYDAIRECADDLIQFGGHKQAAGLTLRTARIDAFRQHFTNVVAGKLNPTDYEPKLNVDVLLDGSQKLALPILKQLKLLEPFGCDNPLPVFAMRDVQLRSPKIFGKEQKHLRFFVNYLNETYHSIMWNGSDYKSCLYNNATADIAFVPKLNVFQGVESINLQVMAFNQGLVIYDYRQGNVDKLTLLKALLQTRSGVTVFTNEETQLPEAWQSYANLHIHHYGTTAPDTENIFVLFDFPKAKIFTEGHFPVPHVLGKTMIILYNVSEFQHLRKEVFAKVPDRRHLIFVYKYVMGMLKTNQVMRIADLKTGAAGQGLVLTDQDLQIFRELGYLDVVNDTVKAAVIQKHELTDSPTYVKLQQYGKDILDLYDSNFRISDAQINALWQNNQQEEK